MKIFNKISIVTPLLILLLGTSCVETVVIGSLAGSAMVVRHKTIEETKNDAIIGAKLTKELISKGLKTPGNSVDFTINEGRVLLTGCVRKIEKAKIAQDLVWAISDVKEVIDEIEVASEEEIKVRDFFRAARDYLVTAEAETKILFARDVSSSNYKITTVNGVIYILGVANNSFEMRRVLAITSKIRGVSRVVNHVILRNDRRRT
jgi:osmotically-inducible protein OsmY